MPSARAFATWRYCEARWRKRRAVDVIGSFIGGLCNNSRFKVAGGPNAGLGQCVRLLNNTRLFEQGDYARNPFENSQVGVFLAYAAPRGRAFLDRALYLPQEWAADRPRREEAGVPETVLTCCAG